MAKRRGKPIQLPIYGNAKHNAGFMLAIGGLVISWANNESVFLSILRMLLGCNNEAAMIVWHSHRTTQGRLEMIGRLARKRVKDTELLQEIENAVAQFKGFSRVRNFYCHAIYSYSDTLDLERVTSFSLTQEGEPIKAEHKWLDQAALNEIANTQRNLMEFNLSIWALASRLAPALGVPPVERPKLPGEDL